MNRSINRICTQMITLSKKTTLIHPKKYSTSDKIRTEIKVAQADMQCDEEETSASILSRIFLMKGVKLFKPMYYTPQDEDDSQGFITLDELLRDAVHYSKQRIISKFNAIYEVLRESTS